MRKYVRFVSKTIFPGSFDINKYCTKIFIIKDFLFVCWIFFNLKDFLVFRYYL